MIAYRRTSSQDIPAMRSFWAEHWGGDSMVVHDAVYRPEDLQGFLALEGEVWAGLVTYILANGECEIVSLDSLRPGQGIGTRLVEQVVAAAQAAGCRRVFLSTTNDNLEALGFYQLLGFELVCVRRGALDRAREVKPGIPLIGSHGIPIRDELELERILPQGTG